MDPVNVLRRARLPEDLWARPTASLHTDEFFRLWKGLEEEAADPRLPLRLGSAISLEAFDPAVFAALCSPDLNTAFRRIGRYKRLVCPLAMHLQVGPRSTVVEIEWLDATVDPPAALVGTEVVFLVGLARLATRHRVEPLAVGSPRALEPAEAYADYFGVPVGRAPRARVEFRAEDAARPFLTANEAVWSFFEPELQKRLAALEEGASMTERVRGALLELLPSGSASLEAVARRLGASPRTVQRRLREEGQTFKGVLNRTREKLARHYLRNPALSGAEISFLLGFEDPNSFFRAFRSWTGLTPERARRELLAAG
ncbi:MAG: AraC family transcriptional regulator [Candidatus Dadabacteria bacterium]|nr:MAG: AraC family transcriptional regulator [Candidatus Dadabacteria bacterium]